MKNFIKKDIEHIRDLFKQVVISDRRGEFLNLDEGLSRTVSLIMRLQEAKLLFIGNGASAAIASHMATDFWKNGGIRAMAFNDGALLTCVSNDYGYERVFEKPIEMFGDREDILIAISSSGSSKNILNGVEAARRRHMSVFTLSGFQEDNPLRRIGDINFYVPSMCYGHVEVLHHALCHSLINAICKKRGAVEREVREVAGGARTVGVSTIDIVPLDAPKQGPLDCSCVDR